MVNKDVFKHFEIHLKQNEQFLQVKWRRRYWEKKKKSLTRQLFSAEKGP